MPQSKFIIQGLLTIMLLHLVAAEWELLLPPDKQRTSFLTAIPYCKPECVVIVAFASGEIYEIDLETYGLTALHVSNDLQSSLTSAPPTYSTSLTAVTLSGEQNMLYAYAQGGSMYYLSLDDSPVLRTWASKTVVTATANVRFMIPITNVQSMDLLVVYDNTFVVLQNIFYGIGIPIGNYQGVATTVLYSDFYKVDSSGNIQNPNLILVGNDQGTVTMFVENNGVATTYTLGTVGGKVGYISHYKSGKKNQWIIFNTIDTTTITNNRLIFVDVNNGNNLRQMTLVTSNFTVFADSYLHDWIIFSNSSGIFKIDISQLTANSSLVIVPIGSTFNAYNSNNKIIGMQNTYARISGSTSSEGIIPCLIVTSSLGAISLYRGDTGEWVELANPLEFITFGNTIVTAVVVESQSPSNLNWASQYTIIATLDDGAIITKVVEGVEFKKGVAGYDKEHYTLQNPPDFINSSAAMTTSPLSFRTLMTLVEERDVVLLSFTDSKGAIVHYQLLGFQEESNSLRMDSPKLILQIANTSSTLATLKEHNVQFFGALLETITLIYDIALIGADLFEIGKQFYYTATEIYDKFTN